MSDKLTSSSGVDPSAKTISVPVFHLYHKLLPGTGELRNRKGNRSSDRSDRVCSPGQPLPPEMTLAQLLTQLYDRKLPQGYQSINLTVKLGSKVISDPGLSKTDSFKRLRTERGRLVSPQSPTSVPVGAAPHLKPGSRTAGPLDRRLWPRLNIRV